MKIFKCKEKALNFFQKNGIIIFPTETVYGIGAKADDEKNILRIFKIKNRSLNNPLIIHFLDLNQILEYCEVTDLEKKIFEKFSPGPITLLLKKKEIKTFCLATNNSIYICARIPKGNFILDLIKKFGPIAAPSCNLSGELTITNEHMMINTYKFIKDIGVYIEDEIIQGIESTILQIINNKIYILRIGEINKKDLFFFGKVIEKKKNKDIIPGNYFLHYQIKKALEIKKMKEEEYFHIGFGKGNFDFNLSKTKNIKEIIKNYYYSLFLGDLSNKKKVSIINFPNNEKFYPLINKLKHSLIKKKE